MVITYLIVISECILYGKEDLGTLATLKYANAYLFQKDHSVTITVVFIYKCVSSLSNIWSHYEVTTTPINTRMSWYFDTSELQAVVIN